MSMENFRDRELGFDLVIAKVCSTSLREDDCDCYPAEECKEVEMDCIECPYCLVAMAQALFNEHYDNCQTDLD